MCQGSKIPQRWVTVSLCFLGLFNAFAMRICLSMAITEMVEAPNNQTMNKSNYSDVQDDSLNNMTLRINKSEKAVKYDWSESTQGLILSSFFWGYFISCVLGGIVCQKFGGKYTLGISILLTSIFTLLTPYCIYLGGSTVLIVLRVIMGFGEGTTFPAVTHLLAQWIPVDERSMAGTVAFSGASLGAIFGYSMSGIILHHSDIGWPMVFYFYGIIGVASFLLNTAFCYNRPSDNPFISSKELTYLEKKLEKTHKNVSYTPWLHILKSRAVFAMICAKIGAGWGSTTIMTDMPKYMSSVLHFSAKDNGYVSSIPAIGLLISGVIFSWIADKVIAKKLASITLVRKVGCLVASIGTAIFFVAAAHAGRNALLVVVFQCIGGLFMGGLNCSVMINSLDLSPNYASAIMGLGNGISVIGASLSPYVVGLLTPNQTMEEWQLVFWIVGFTFVASSIVFLIFASGEVQDWNDPDYSRKEKLAKLDENENGVELSPLNKQ